MLLRARHFEFVFPRRALVMGILNVTPDSFSDGGRWLETRQAVEQGVKLVEQGADLIDVGGESTRPGAAPVDETEELRRVIPVLEQLAARVKVPLSIDTMKPAVAEAAVAVGASIVNDVAANRSDDRMWRLVAGTGVGYVAMHMQGLPGTMQSNPRYEDVTRNVYEFFEDRLAQLQAAGVAAGQVVLDVGIGFGKTLEHNLQLLAALGSFTKLKRPLLLGISRKSFLGALTGAGVGERLPGSLAGACWAIQSGAHVIRTHDVAETVQALRVTEAILEHQSQSQQ